MNRAFRCGLAVFAAVFWGGCSGNGDDAEGAAGQAGSSTAGTSAAGSGGSSGSGGSGGSAGSAGESAGAPLLERPAELAYDCEVTRPMALLGLNPWVSGGLHGHDGAAYLTRIQGTMPLVTVGMKVTWSSLGLDGVLGSAQSFPAPEQTYVGQLAAAQVDARLGLLWSEATGNDSKMLLATVEAGGDVPGEPQTLASGAGQRYFPVVAPLGDGYLAGWTLQSGGGSGGSTIEVQRVGADGKPSGDVLPLLEGTGLLQTHELVPLGDGLILLYSQVDYASNLQGNYYVRLNASGAKQGEPVKLGDGFGPSSSLRRADQLLVAWTEQTGNYDSKMSRTVHVGRIGASGELVGAKHALQAPVLDQENVDPHWVDMGDDVGLFWSQGSVIYICAGCFPDNELKFVVLGGDDWKRKSEVLTLPSPVTFGLRSPLAVRQGDDLLAIASVTHHTDAEGASATVRCTP